MQEFTISDVVINAPNTFYKQHYVTATLSTKRGSVGLFEWLNKNEDGYFSVERVDSNIFYYQIPYVSHILSGLPCELADLNEIFDVLDEKLAKTS